MKAIIIARVSTEEQKEAGNSLPAQIVRLEKYCAHKGFEVIKSFSFDESAYTNTRIEFSRIVTFVLQQKSPIVVCFDKVDRLSRNVFDRQVALLFEKALRSEIELHFVSEGRILNANSPAAEIFAFNMTLSLSKYYSDSTRDNVKRGIEQKVRRGEFSGKVPYGYKNVRVGDKNDVIVDDHAAQIVRTAFELYATRAYSMNVLCKKLNAEYGLRWSTGRLDWLLAHPFYSGEMRWGDTLLPHKYPPLITKALFTQVQQIKHRFAIQPRKQSRADQYIYQGVFRCSQCKTAITHEVQKGHVYYHCTQSKMKHGGKWIREETITESLQGVFKRLQFPEEFLKEITMALRTFHAQKTEFRDRHLEHLISEQKQINKALDKLYEDKLMGNISNERHDQFYATFRDRLNDVNMRREHLQEADDNYYMTAGCLIDIAHNAHDAFARSNAEDRRLLLKLVFQNLEIDNGNVLWDVKEPFKSLLYYSDRQDWCARQDSNLWPPD